MNDLSAHKENHHAKTFIKKDVYRKLVVRSIQSEFDELAQYDPFYGSNMSLFAHNQLDHIICHEAVFREKLQNILKNNNIDVMEKLEKGAFSWSIDIGEGQVLHISSPPSSCKKHKREKEPEILQPLYVFPTDGDLKIEILPKVKTEGVTKEHIYALISSLAKKGLLFADCKPENVGLITVNGQEMPVVIGDGSVVNIHYNYDSPINTDLFYTRIHQLQLRCGIYSNPSVSLFFTNDDYTKYPWVDEQNGKWAQDEYVQNLGLGNVKQTGHPKGIIPKDTITEMQNIEDLSPLAKELVDLIAECCLRKKDVNKLAADKIAELIEKGGAENEAIYTKHVAASRERTESQPSICS